MLTILLINTGAVCWR